MDPRVEKILKLPAKIRAIILVVVLVLEVVAFYFVMYSPELEKLDQLKGQLVKLDSQVAQKRVIAGGLEKFKQEYAKAQEELKRALEKLPDKKEIPSLLTSISSAAKDQGMEIQLFRPGAEFKQDFYAVVPVSLEMKGTYHETALFFESLARLTRIVNVKDYSMQGSGGGVSVKCNVETYRFLDPSEIQSAKNSGKKSAKNSGKK